jgi:DNA-binding NarL/FixJ family response regulator
MMSSVRILLVDDFEPWRRFVSATLKNKLQLQVLCEVANGLEAVQKAQELQPDLILLDIGLPGLNGIEAARRIRKLSPKSKILFLSEKQSLEIAAEALGTDAKGYLIKSDAGAELLVAVENVLQGKQFMSARLAGNDYVEHGDSQVGSHSGLSVDTG